MYKSTVTLCADKIIQDANTSMISAIDVFEEFVTPGLPFLIPNFSILWTQERDDGDSATPTGRVRISQGDSEIGNFPLDIDFHNVNRTRSIIVINGLVISQPATLKVEFFRDGAVQATLEYPVRVTPTVVTPAAATPAAGS